LAPFSQSLSLGIAALQHFAAFCSIAQHAKLKSGAQLGPLALFLAFLSQLSRRFAAVLLERGAKKGRKWVENGRIWPKLGPPNGARKAREQPFSNNAPTTRLCLSPAAKQWGPSINLAPCLRVAKAGRVAPSAPKGGGTKRLSVGLSVGPLSDLAQSVSERNSERVRLSVCLSVWVLACL